MASEISAQQPAVTHFLLLTIDSSDPMLHNKERSGIAMVINVSGMVHVGAGGWMGGGVYW